MGLKKARLLGSTFLVGALLGLPGVAFAFDYQTSSGVDIRLDNTIEYSVLERTSPENSALAGAANANDGDNNLRAGIVSNRVDLLTKFDISYQGYGFDATAASFYDTVYNQHTQNGDFLTYNSANEPPNKFPSATRTRAGRDIELRNLFVYGSGDIDGMPVTLRVGRFASVFGESLLFAANGISYGQSPIDVYRAYTVPNTQAKDLFLPVGQAMITVQPTQTLSISAYYQFEWSPFNYPPAASYFSQADIISYGASRILVPGTAGIAGPNSQGYFYRGPDAKGASNGQFGIALHYDPQSIPWDFGLYALQFNDTEPQIYAHLAAAPFFPSSPAGTPKAVGLGSYNIVYANHIQIYGASASTTLGPVNLAGEISIRVHNDLKSNLIILGPGVNAGNSSNNHAYATGNTLQYQVSAIYLGPRNAWSDGSQVLAEAAGHNILSFDSNRQNFDYAGAQHMAFGIRTIGSLQYNQVLPGLDLSPNIGLGWDFMGKSPEIAAFNNYGIDRGGDLTLGVSYTYLNKWTGGISYTRFIAPPGRDPFADRDFGSFNVERTF